VVVAMPVDEAVYPNEWRGMERERERERGKDDDNEYDIDDNTVIFISRW
jgi:hypothetical protein